ncbi:hypothetical protein MTO96_049727 [Rhipicephalus appendiculatus]
MMDDRETAAPPVKKARSGRHVSLLQKEALVSFLEDHPALARPSSELGGTCSAHQRQSLWEEVATMLNGMGPATKEAAGWRRFWNDLVAQFKKDSAVVSDATTGTGGGKLPGLGGKVLSLIGRDCVVGCAPSLFLEVPTVEPQQPTNTMEASIEDTPGQLSITVPRQPTRRASACAAASSVDPLTTLVEDQRALIEEVRGLRAEQHADARTAGSAVCH